VAWALTLAGSAKSLSVDTPFYLPTNCDLEINMAWNAISSNYEMIFGTWATGASDEQFYFGKYNAPNGTYTLYKRGGAVRSNSSVGEIVVDTYAVLTLERRGDNLRVLKDGVEICASITFPSGVLDNALIKTFCAGNESGFNANVSVKSVTLKNIDTATTTNLWDATASDHNNSSGQTRLIDTVGGNDATGVNMDASAWIDLGGTSSIKTLSAEQIEQGEVNSIIANIDVHSVTGQQSEEALTVILSGTSSITILSAEQVEQGEVNSIIANIDVHSVTGQQSEEALTVVLAGASSITILSAEQVEQGEVNSIIANIDILTVIGEQREEALVANLVDALSITSLPGEQVEQGQVNSITTKVAVHTITAEQLENAFSATIVSDLILSTYPGEQQEHANTVHFSSQITTKFLLEERNLQLIKTTPNFLILKITSTYSIEKL